MREIKFRAWDKESRRMFNIARFDFADHTVYSHLFACEGHLAENLKIMQYTGLKDKNGTDIYEGDIFRDNDAFIWQVYNEDGMFMARGGEYGLSELLIEFVPDHCEIVGNIHENPELLDNANN